MKKVIILLLAALFVYAHAETVLEKAQNTFRALAYAQEACTKAEKTLSTVQVEAGDVATATNELVQAQNACNALITAQSAAIMLGVQDSQEQKALDALTRAQILVANNAEDKQAKANLNALVNAQLAVIKAKKKTESLPEAKPEGAKPYLWVYWECVNGAPMPGYISLCRKALLKHCKNSFNIVELDNNNIYDHLPELREKEEKIKATLNSLAIAQKVDYYRVLLLYKYGGLYFDSDMLVMKDLKGLVEKLDRFDYLGFGRHVDGGSGERPIYGIPENWGMASRPKGILISRVLRNQENKLRNNAVTDYYDLGRNAIREELQHLFAHNYQYYHCPSDLEDCLYPGSMFTDERFSYNNFNKVLFFVLFNNSIPDEYKKMTEEQLLKSDMLFAQVAKISLGL